MSKGFKLFWIVTVVVVIGFSMTSCDDKCCSGGASSEVTITGIPGHSGRYGVIFLYSGGGSYETAWGFELISGDSVTLNSLCWVCDGPYALSGSYDAFFMIFNDLYDEDPVYLGYIRIRSFSSSTTIPWIEIISL